MCIHCQNMPKEFVRLNHIRQDNMAGRSKKQNGFDRLCALDESSSIYSDTFPHNLNISGFATCFKLRMLCGICF